MRKLGIFCLQIYWAREGQSHVYLEGFSGSTLIKARNLWTLIGSQLFQQTCVSKLFDPSVWAMATWTMCSSYLTVGDVRPLVRQEPQENVVRMISRSLGCRFRICSLTSGYHSSLRELQRTWIRSHHLSRRRTVYLPNPHGIRIS